jgi:predicted lipoprotein with Yx(FWY)xxD motif
MKPFLALAPLGLALVAAGCGGGGGNAPDAHTARSSAPQTVTASFAKVSTRHTKLGTVLVDGNGRTLYLFEKDKGTTSACYGSCASVWPPLVTNAKASAGGGALAAKLSSSKRADGKSVVTYAGHPLYTYAGDGKPGDVHGQEANQFGAKWYAVSPNGRKVDDDD